MDIWAWVEKLTNELEENGQEHAASLFYRYVDYVTGQDIPQAEALFPEVMAMAKAMENPWAEVFFRHWEMRLRLGIKGEGESALPAAVDLLDFAHSKACEGCPQSMCTRQDIADCYGNIDGPGWAEERRAVALEGLAEITPEWNCYGCLYHQYMHSLNDEKRYSEALAVMEEYEANMLAAGKETDAQDMIAKAHCYHFLNRNEEALALLDKAAKHPDMENDERRRVNERLARVAVLAALGKLEEAWEILPSWGNMVPGDYMEWLNCAADVASGDPQRNTWGLGSCFQEGLEHYSSVGAHRYVIDLGKRGIELAIARGAYSTPRRFLRMMQKHLPKLRKPLGAEALLAELEKTVAALPAPKLPVPAAQLVEHIKTTDHPNAEEGLDWLYAALEELPDDMDILLTACSALSAMNATSEARELLWDVIRRKPEDCEDAVNAFVRYSTVEENDELRAVADFVEPKSPYLAHWARLYAAYRSMNIEDVAEHAKRFLALRPDSIGARMIWSNAAMHVNNFADATRLRKEAADIVANNGDDANNYRWDLLVAATCAEDWKLVRDTCVTMEFDIEPGDTPIDDPGQYVRIIYEEEGKSQSVIAQRNGPVTARIVGGCWPRLTQRTQDLVVFDPELLEPYPDDEEERKYFYPPYNLVHTLEKGNFRSWLVDGFYPGQEEFTRFREALEERGFFVDSRCASDYTITDPDWEGDVPEYDEDDEDVPFPPPGRLDGIYFLLSAPASFPPAELDAILTQETKGWAHPMCWYELASVAGKSPEKHEALIEKYGL